MSQFQSTYRAIILLEYFSPFLKLPVKLAKVRWHNIVSFKFEL